MTKNSTDYSAEIFLSFFFFNKNKTLFECNVVIFSSFFPRNLCYFVDIVIKGCLEKDRKVEARKATLLIKGTRKEGKKRSFFLSASYTVFQSQ